MKNYFKRFASVAMAVLLVLSLSVSAFAADSVITFKGAAEGFDFQPGSEYTATDLFDNFKGIMPGDHLTEIVTLKNAATDCNYIKLYMRAEVHDETENPLSDKVAEAETVASMTDFLSQLTMRIYNGEELIYEASPDEAGALADNVLLGSLTSGESLTLRVELDVPADLGNAYANRVGEVDWVFLAECIEFGKLTVHKVWEDNGYPDRPDSVDVQLLKNGETFETVQLSEENQWTYTWDELDDQYQWSVEEIVPEGYEASYTTEDNCVFITNHMDYEPPADPDPVQVTVKKVWSDEDNKNGTRPSSVSVTLYNGETPVDKVILNEENDWTYTWEKLDGNGIWCVLETGVPKGYTPSYTCKDGTVTITNTATLIQTGQLNWPIPVLGGLGMVLIVCGVLMTRRKKNENA